MSSKVGENTFLIEDFSLFRKFLFFILTISINKMKLHQKWDTKRMTGEFKTLKMLNSHFQTSPYPKQFNQEEISSTEQSIIERAIN